MWQRILQRITPEECNARKEYFSSGQHVSSLNTSRSPAPADSFAGVEGKFLTLSPVLKLIIQFIDASLALPREDVLNELDDNRHLIDTKATYPSNLATTIGMFKVCCFTVELIHLNFDIFGVKNAIKFPTYCIISIPEIRKC